MNDLFYAQSQIMQQLTQEVPDLRLVRGVRALTDLQERPGNSPAAYVLYDGQEVRMAAGFAQVVDQKWLVVLVTRQARPTAPLPKIPPESDPRPQPGPLLIQLCRALLGWQAGADYGAFSLANAPNPYFREGFGFYPLRFITRLVIQPE